VLAENSGTQGKTAASLLSGISGCPARCRTSVGASMTDPTEASMIFRRRRLGDAGWTVTFGAAGGLLTYWVLQPEQIVVLLDLTWAG
jgi:hypothetical protein